MQKKKNNFHTSLSEIINQEIKESSLRQGFPKSFDVKLNNLKYKNFENHKDFTNIPFVTIDGEDSKDFDDAVWSENKEETTRIMIAIADVSFYVEKNDLFDLEAKKRGNSFYFPDRVIPMFPEKISNDLCSLVPNKVRACLVVEIIIKNFKIECFKLHRAKIKSIARLTYNQVDQIFFSEQKSNINFDVISSLFKSYKILKKISEMRNKINFSRDEFQIIINKNNEFFFKKKDLLESYKLIEEFMVLANECIAKVLKDNKLDSIFRNHEKPNRDKVEQLKLLLKDNNILENEEFDTQKDFNLVLKKIKDSNSNLNEFLLKSQSSAYYSKTNLGHFGLGLQYYTHFTSPIRRYSDLEVHRDIINYYFKKPKKNYEEFLSDHLTNQEKKSDYLEKRIVERACSLLIKNKKKKYFTGIIDGIESFGVFVKALDLPFSCLIRIKNKYNEKSKNNEKNLKKNLKIGQLVSFKIKRNDVRSGKILGDKLRTI